MIPCKNVYNNILNQPFLVDLNVVAFPVQLKIKYHNDSGKPIIVKVGILRAQSIQESILTNPLSASFTPERSGREDDRALDVFHLDVC